MSRPTSIARRSPAAGWGQRRVPDGGGVVVVVVAAEPDILLPPADVVERVAAFGPALDQVVAPKELDRNLLVGRGICGRSAA